jgi:hypothetical protein
MKSISLTTRVISLSYFRPMAPLGLFELLSHAMLYAYPLYPCSHRAISCSSLGIYERYLIPPQTGSIRACDYESRALLTKIGMSRISLRAHRNSPIHAQQRPPINPKYSDGTDGM